jgi:hypothetical protein
MMAMFTSSRRVQDVTCTIDIEHTSDSLHAHVDLPDEIILGPGDEVIVQGPPIHVPFGEKALIERTATIVRATAFDRFWIRIVSWTEIFELYDLSFTSRRKP